MRAVLVVPADVRSEQSPQLRAMGRDHATPEHLLLQRPEEPLDDRGRGETAFRAVALLDAPARAPGPIAVAVELRPEIGDEVPGCLTALGDGPPRLVVKRGFHRIAVFSLHR